MSAVTRWWKNQTGIESLVQSSKWSCCDSHNHVIMIKAISSLHLIWLRFQMILINKYGNDLVLSDDGVSYFFFLSLSLSWLALITFSSSSSPASCLALLPSVSGVLVTVSVFITTHRTCLFFLLSFSFGGGSFLVAAWLRFAGSSSSWTKDGMLLNTVQMADSVWRQKQEAAAINERKRRKRKEETPSCSLLLSLSGQLLTNCEVLLVWTLFTDRNCFPLSIYASRSLSLSLIAS